MAETIEEVSYNYEDEGKLVRKEMKKEVLTKGAWATVMFLYQELDRKTEAWGPRHEALTCHDSSTRWALKACPPFGGDSTTAISR